MSLSPVNKIRFNTLRAPLGENGKPLTLAQIAARCNPPTGAMCISKMVNGHMQSKRLRRQVARILKTTVGYLCGEDE